MAPHEITALTPLTNNSCLNSLGDNHNINTALQSNFYLIVKQERFEDLIDFLAVYADQINLDAVERRTGFSALSMASIEGSLRKVKRLIKLGADPRRLDAHGYACIHYATAYGHTDLSSFLLKNGVC